MTMKSSSLSSNSILIFTGDDYFQFMQVVPQKLNQALCEYKKKSKKNFQNSQITKYFRLPKKNLTIAPTGGPPDLSVVYTDRASFMWGT